VSKPLDPGYWRRYRATHPGYRERERIRSASRLVKSHGDRAAQYARRRLRLLRDRGDNGITEQGHPIMDQAMAVASRYVKRDQRTVLYDPTWEDAVMVAALAICRGEDPGHAVGDYVRVERSWMRRTAPMWPA